MGGRDKEALEGLQSASLVPGLVRQYFKGIRQIRTPDTLLWPTVQPLVTLHRYIYHTYTLYIYSHTKINTKIN